MTSFQIKLIAIITMIVDHIGLFFFPDVLAFRMVGRLSFSLFAWLIATGARHTKDINHYLARLFLFGLISQAPYALAHSKSDVNFSQLNVLFTLFLGLAAIGIIQKTKNKWIWVVSTLVASFLAILFNVAFGMMGVLSIVFFYIFYDNLSFMAVSQTIIYFLQLPLYLYNNIPITGYLPILAVLSVILIYLYNGNQGKKAKYLFYVIYPLQYIVFYFLLQL